MNNNYKGNIGHARDSLGWPRMKPLEPACISYIYYSPWRSSHSTVTASIEMYHQWVEAFENDKLSAVVMLDLKGNIGAKK